MIEYPKPPFPKQKQAMPGLTSKMEPAPDHGEQSYKGSGRLVGKKAIITGGDSGIGRAVALAFAREGADLLISYLNEHEDAEETKRLVDEAGRRAVLFPGDIQHAAHCRAIVEKAVRRKLQHDRALAFAKMREQHDLSVGKFQRIMVRARLVHVHLPELGDPVRQRPGPPEQKLVAGEMTLDLFLKNDLSARKEADGYPRFFHRGKSACGCIPELRRDQLVPDPGGPRRNAVQAVVAHGEELRFVKRPCDPDANKNPIVRGVF